MKPMDLGIMWMLGVIGVMVIYGLFAIYGINKNSKEQSHISESE